MRTVAIALLLLVSSPFTPARADLYGGVSYTRVDYDEEGFETASPTAATFKLGAPLGPNLDLETRLGVGVSDDDTFGCVPGVGCGTVTLEVDYYFGVYLKGSLPTGTVSPYGLIGYTKGELTGTSGAVSLSASDSDLSFGVGLDVPVSDTLGLDIEYAQLVDGPAFEVTSLSAGITFKF